MDSARYVIGCHVPQETSVQNACDDVASTIHEARGECSTRHRMPYTSRNQARSQNACDDVASTIHESH
jgi:hypothetical protein